MDNEPHRSNERVAPAQGRDDMEQDPLAMEIKTENRRDNSGFHSREEWNWPEEDSDHEYVMDEP